MAKKVAEGVVPDKKGCAEELLLTMRARVAEAREALAEADEEKALALLQQALAMKHRLWEDLTPRVRVLARKFAPYTRRKAGLSEDDLAQEAYFKFVKVIRLWDPARGVSVPGWVLFSLGRHFIQLGRAGRLVSTEDIERLVPTARRRTMPCRLEFEDLIERLLPNDRRRARKRRLFRRYWFEGWNMSELARQEKVAVSTIHKWLGQTGAAFAELFVASAR